MNKRLTPEMFREAFDGLRRLAAVKSNDTVSLVAAFDATFWSSVGAIGLRPTLPLARPAFDAIGARGAVPHMATVNRWATIVAVVRTFDEAIGAGVTEAGMAALMDTLRSS